MATLAVVVLGFTLALSPHIVFPAIYKSGWLYWVGVAMLLILYIGSMMIDQFSAHFTILKYLIAAAVGSYTLMTNARILGIIYREKRTTSTDFNPLTQFHITIKH